MKKPLKEKVKDYLQKIDYDNWEDDKYFGNVEIETKDMMNIIKADKNDIKQNINGSQ